MGDKAAARRIAREAGVPVIPGSDGALASNDDARHIARAIGYPLLIKAAAGGGGKGMRIVEAPGELEAALLAARAEALAAFGSADVYLERYLADVRHVEVQVLGDGSDVIDLGERDCTIQRRHQKLIEEAPSPALSAHQREQLLASGARLARHVGYVNAGTVEFVLDNRSGECFFIEMNTRLQVEHPVTEMTTGVDLVAQQLAVAAGEKLAPGGAASRGHAIECRINAEDPQRGFLPQPGTITGFALPVGESIRVDTHAAAGTTITPFYDSLVAKVVVHGDTRARAIARMRGALDAFRIDGITTNLSLQRSIMDDARFASGAFGTRFLEAR
jgi:acetyl-CoA carboxylase biotin carboxylase subunit